jgi:hypothetical protein
VLGLVLEHHVVDVAVAQEWRLRVELGRPQQIESFSADLVDVFVGLVAGEKGKVPPAPARVVEGVVHLVVSRIVCRTATDLAQKPVLLKVADMANVPHDRAHDGVELLVHVVVAQRIHDVVGTTPDAGELSLEVLFGPGGVPVGNAHSDAREVRRLARTGTPVHRSAFPAEDRNGGRGGEKSKQMPPPTSLRWATSPNFAGRGHVVLLPENGQPRTDDRSPQGCSYLLATRSAVMRSVIPVSITPMRIKRPPTARPS